MTDEELIQKMDTLGQALYDFEIKQREFEEKNKVLITKIAELKDQLKPEFLKMKKGMLSEKLEVIYRKGAIRWDSKRLKEFAKANPWLNDFTKEDEPTVAFKRREEHDDDGR